jgi:methylmalonyl-CoA mutase N-terminal domain/subunit
MRKQLDLFTESHSEWINQLKRSNERKTDFQTLSGESLEPCYFPKVPDDDYNEKLGFPGQFPFTRGVHANLYRGKLWTMRQFAGYGSPE